MPEPFPYIAEGDWSAVNRLREDAQRRIDFVPQPIYVGITAGAPGFQNSWVNNDGNTPPTHRCAFFYKDRGRVYLGGVIKSGTSGTAAFTLPVGYQPIAQTDDSANIPVLAAGGVAYVALRVNGEVRPTNQGATTVATFCFLDGVSFVTQQ